MSDEPPIDGIRDFRWPFRNVKDLVAELFCACRWQIGSGEAADFAASYLFDELRRRVGPDEAQKAFERASKAGAELSEQHEIRMLLFRLHMMENKRTGQRGPNVQGLARIIAAENEAFNKSAARRGRPARPTNQPSIEQQIKRLRKKHEPAFLKQLGLPQAPAKKKLTPKTSQKGARSQLKFKAGQRNSATRTDSGKMSGTSSKKKSSDASL